ncbi:hypothetical protein PO150_18385 [Bacteroides ovatus]|uniref:DUF4906 domain-containing protein n=1 Tax=Bacteroides ovatus TaxID=28116 RepID=A0AAP3WMN4_BACOV|nr:MULTISPECIES: hypothetical protein [Bacteroides]MCS2377292.1 hypothetical protein [Bacteroides ovatus]MCS2799529.1 hypothetical protein [Bacteroides ovatus]MCS3031501.1 hypothetical protein [Bacteroides ovatus]MCS3138997.1 hypothetical protein [Bacteroides ovatus]MCZ2714462.1 hypothetical protein [Bacteroides ovatus]
MEDIRNCDIGNVDNMIPDGKERMELRLVIPGGKQPVVRSIENGMAGENKVERLFMDVMNSGTVIASRSTADGALTLTPTDVDSVYAVSTLFDIGTLEAGYTLRVRANEDTPAIISGQPVSPFYMSGTGVIEDGINRNFKASVHLLRGVAKLRTTVRTTSFTVPQELMIGDVKIQVIHAADRIRKYAPFSSHANEAVVENLPASSLNYPDYPEVSLYDILAHEQVEINGEAITFYPLFVYENYLEQEEEYDPAINVTSLKLTIPVTDGIASRVIERTIPVKAEDSYRMKRNHIYSVDVQVLSLDEVKVFTDMLDWEDVGVTGDIVGGVDFDIDRTKITLIKDIVDPVKLLKVDCHAPGRLQIRALKPNKTDLISTTDLQLYCNGITETDKLADNSGIYDLTAAQVMNFYCTTGSVPANYEGGFIEISSDNVHVEYIPVSSLDTFTPLDTEGTANSYIADRGAGSYSFTATIMGNGVDGIIDEGKFEDASGNILTKAGGANIHPLSAKLLWQDTDELVEQVALVNGRVQVKMGRSRGNAVIAVYDKTNPNAEDAKVLWSWHLWCTATPKILEFVTSIYTGNNYKVMDRNLGATATKAYLGTVQGLHYQWGRKDPFSGSLTYDGIRTILYDVRSGQGVYKYSDERVTAGQAISTPSSLYSPRRGLGGESWCTKTTELKYLWGNPDGEQDAFPKETLKSLYDPCPYGYKVAPHDVFKILSKGEIAIFPPAGASLGDMYFIKSYFANGSTFYYDNAGIDETKLIYLPETYRPNGDGIKLGKWGVYWCSSPHPADKEHSGLMFNFHPYTAMDFEYNIYNPVVTSVPASIRCVKE